MSETDSRQVNKNNFEAELINYGSHETGLSIEFSDIDILGLVLIF